MNNTPNPFDNVQIPQNNDGFVMGSNPPSAPQNGIMQNQTSGFNMNEVMGVPIVSQSLENFSNTPQPQSVPQLQGQQFNKPATSGFPQINNQQFNSQPINPQSNQRTNQLKYNIADLYYFINRKIYNGIQLNQNEVPILIIGYNADFNSLRLVLNNYPNEINPSMNYINVKEVNRLTSVNLYTETSHQIFEAINNIGSNTCQIPIVERIFNLNNWNPNSSIFNISQNEIILYTQTSNNQQYMFTFLEHHISGLKYCLHYALNGNGWNQHMNVRFH